MYGLFVDDTSLYTAFFLEIDLANLWLTKVCERNEFLFWKQTSGEHVGKECC